ncbi:MAG: hypothetical protein OXU23_03380 [Candidatus Poribacteria bacterium]|nr:hypothetical protein [Candidatus Poribacteria bacterium]
MFKRRQDSQAVANEILDRIENRTGYLLEPRELSPNIPLLTTSVQPIFPYRPIISPSTIYELHMHQPFPPRRVGGGVCYLKDDECFEFNEYGFVYHSKLLSVHDKNNIRRIHFGGLLYQLNSYFQDTREFYKHCEYLGEIEVKVQMHNVSDHVMEGLSHNGRSMVPSLTHGALCSESEVVAVKRCLSRDLQSRVKRVDLVEELIGKVLWSFDIPIDEERVRDLVRRRIDEGVR